MSKIRAAALLCFSSLALGFLLGRWAMPAPGSRAVVIGSAAPLPGRDLSPAGAPVGSVVMPKVRPGTPKAPPSAGMAPGSHLSTTSAAVPPLPLGGTFQAATFAAPAPDGLRLRSVLWLEAPGGLVPLGETVTTERPQAIQLPAPAPPRWGASVLTGSRPQDGRLVLGGLLQYERGPIIAGVGQVGGMFFCSLGTRW